MLDRNHSRTAEATAAIRACHLRYDSPLVFADPYAAQLTSPWWRTVASNPVLYWSIVRGLLGPLRPVHGWILVRDQLTVDDLRVFVANGGRQYVVARRRLRFHRLTPSRLVAGGTHHRGRSSCDPGGQAGTHRSQRRGAALA